MAVFMTDRNIDVSAVSYSCNVYISIIFHARNWRWRNPGTTLNANFLFWALETVSRDAAVARHSACNQNDHHVHNVGKPCLLFSPVLVLNCLTRITCGYFCCFIVGCVMGEGGRHLLKMVVIVLSMSTIMIWQSLMTMTMTMTMTMMVMVMMKITDIESLPREGIGGWLHTVGTERRSWLCDYDYDDDWYGFQTKINVNTTSKKEVGESDLWWWWWWWWFSPERNTDTLPTAKMDKIPRKTLMSCY